MGDGGEFLPRVNVHQSERSGGVRVNFGQSLEGFDDLPEGLKKLYELFDDWTAFCIASIAHLPSLSQVGHMFMDRHVQESLVDFLKKNSISHELTEAENGEKNYSFILHEEDVALVAAELSTTEHLMKAAIAIQRSNLTALISELDYFLSRLMSAICNDFPQKIVSDDAEIKVNFLRSGNTLRDWEVKQIAKTIDSKLRESHEASILWLLQDLAEVQEITKVTRHRHYREFLEVCQRRNILIHNGGMVNQQYRAKCLAAGIPAKDIPDEGESLGVSSTYLRSSAARVYLVGIYTLSLCALKLYPKHKRIVFRSLLAASHDFISAGMTKQVERVIEFAEFNVRDFDQDLKLKFAINRALAKLFEPGVEEENQTANAQNILDKYDWSVTGPIFDLALACLKRDFSELIPLAQKAAEAGLSYCDARSFCVFQEAREVEGFLQCFPRSLLMIEEKKEINEGGD